MFPSLVVVVTAVLASSTVVVALLADCPCYEDPTDPGLVVCANKSLVDIPKCVADNVTRISIRTPSIPLVPATIKRFTGLKELSVDSFKRPKLSKTFLSGQRELPFFQISFTSLEYVDKDWFKYSYKMVTLFLSDNRIRSLDPGTFSYLRGLQVLSLDGNLLTTLPPTIFTQHSYLKQLYLHNNRWYCDSDLVSFIKWAINRGVKIPYLSSCAYPPEREGLELVFLNI